MKLRIPETDDAWQQIEADCKIFEQQVEEDFKSMEKQIEEDFKRMERDYILLIQD